MRGVGFAVDELDAKLGAGEEEGSGGEDLGVVHIEFLGDAALEKGLLEAVLELRKAMIGVELGVADEAGGVIEDGIEEGPGSRAIHRGEVRAIERIELPAVIGIVEGEGSAVGLGEGEILVKAFGLLTPS